MVTNLVGSKYNSYGIVSGWHLFAVADKACVKYLLKHHSEYKYWLTSFASVNFVRQVCKGDKIKSRVCEIDIPCTGTVRLRVELTSNDDICFAAELEFVGKNRLHCDIN